MRTLRLLPGGGPAGARRDLSRREHRRRRGGGPEDRDRLSGPGAAVRASRALRRDGRGTPLGPGDDPRRRAAAVRGGAPGEGAGRRGPPNRGSLLAPLGSDPPGDPRAPRQRSQGDADPRLRRGAHGARLRHAQGQPARPWPSSFTGAGEPALTADEGRPGPVPPLAGRARGGASGGREVADPGPGPGNGAGRQAWRARLRPPIPGLPFVLARAHRERPGAGLGDGRCRVRHHRRPSLGARGPRPARGRRGRPGGRRVAGDESRRPPLPLPRLRLRGDLRPTNPRGGLPQLPACPGAATGRHPQRGLRSRRARVGRAGRVPALLVLPGEPVRGRRLRHRAARGLCSPALPPGPSPTLRPAG